MRKHWVMTGLAALSALALSAVEVPDIFSDHAVLLRSSRTPVFGTGAPDEKVKVEFASLVEQTEVGKDGSWRVNLDLSGVNAGPFQLKITGNNAIVINDVLVGDVWLCSGQSNMEFGAARCIDAGKFQKACKDNEFRSFKMSRLGLNVKKGEKMPKLGEWVIISPETFASRSGVAYFFGRKLRKEIRRPLGLIESYWGGTPSEAWTSRKTLDTDPGIKTYCAEILYRHRSYDARREKYLKALDAWCSANGRSDVPSTGIPVEGWKDFKPGRVPGNGGIYWVKLTVPATEKMTYWLAGDKEPVDVYVNGKLFRKISRSKMMDYYLSAGIELPALPEGKAELTLRFCAPVSFKFVGLQDKKRAVYGKSMQICVERSFPKLSKEQADAMPKSIGLRPKKVYQPYILFDTMIRPFVPYGLTGVIWYQGETNAHNWEHYYKLFPMLIADWREHFEKPALPFLYCQLANYQPKSSDPADTGKLHFVEIRDAQWQTLSVPRTGMAVLIDVGEAGDIHPRNKQIPGERLAAQALKMIYHQNIPAVSPYCSGVKFDGNKVILEFAEQNGGLVASPVPATYIYKSLKNDNRKLVRNSPDSQLEGFALCGEDGVWHWADDAKIVDDHVEVTCKAVPAPKHVRYLWQDNPTGNLYSRAGFPAVPFQW